MLKKKFIYLLYDHHEYLEWNLRPYIYFLLKKKLLN